MADNNQDINQLLKVRREKLAELQEQGNDPFAITKERMFPSQAV